MIDLKEKFAGTMLGLAIGDALGYAVEFSSLAEIHRRYGPNGITELSSTLFSDDTQMSMAVARGLVEAGRDANVDDAAPFVARQFIEWSRNPPGGHRAPGGACMAGCRALAHGFPWEDAGDADAGGCGSVMRSAPYALRFWKDEDAAIECAARHSRMTHRHPLALAASAALASGVWCALRDAPRQLIVARMIDAAMRYDVGTARMMREDARLAVDVIAQRAPRAATTADVLDRRRGWAGHEAVSAAMFCFAIGDDYADTIRLAANSPGDSDSIACIAGALSGAHVGLAGIPSRWHTKIERRDELMALARLLLHTAGDESVLFQIPET